MESGYTWFDAYGVQLLCVVERRKCDNRVQVVVYPKENVSFSFQKLDQDRSSMPWRNGEELIKVYGDVSAGSYKAGEVVLSSLPINVFVKTVEEFSLDKGDLQKDPKIFVHQTMLRPC